MVDIDGLVARYPPKDGGWEGATIRGETIDVERGLQLDSGTWSNCHFRAVGRQAHLQFLRDVELLDCRVSLADGSALKLAAKRIKRLAIRGSGRSLEAHHALLECCELDDLYVEKASMRDSLVIGTSVALRCRDFYSERTSFRGGAWNPEVELTSELIHVAFEDDCQLSMESLVTSCPDRTNVHIRTTSVEDPWATLRDGYTGAKLVFVVLMTLAFFAPYVFRTIYYAIAARVTTPSPENEEYLAALLLWGDRAGLPMLLYGSLSAGLIVYNAGRLWLTMSIAVMREREEHFHSYGVSRYRPPKDRVQRLWRLHRVGRWFLLMAVASSVWRVCDVLSMRVPA